jgi:nucleoid DNA-binding protein
VTFAHLVEVLHLETGLTRRAIAELLRLTTEVIGKRVAAGERVLLPHFGVFSRRRRKSRAIRNPQNNELMRLPTSFTVGFRAGRDLKKKATRLAQKRPPPSAEHQEP